MFMKDTTHILVEKEKGLKHKKHPEMGKNYKYEINGLNVVIVYTVGFFYSCTAMTINTFFFTFQMM